MRVPTSLARMIAILALLGVVVPTAGAAQTALLKRVSYLGAKVTVPSGWPVVDLASAPRTCVRFDRHAVYLGRPSSLQRCPAHLAGRTEALLLEPLAVGTAAAGSRTGGAPVGEHSAEVRLPGTPVIAVATWNRHPRTVARAVSLHHLVSPRRSDGHTSSVTPARAARVTGHSASAYTTGLGFDACATPSISTMTAWRASPYRSVGIYLGGANEACAQPNLTSAWVRTETAAGWHLIPTYVGLQAPRTSCSCATINPSRAASQGAAAAADAIASAQSVGIRRGNPILYDMEAYETGGGATRTVLTFLSAWTTALHRGGYLSGVYSSSASGITDLVNAQGTSFVEPDEVWFAHWNDAHTAADSYLPPEMWAAHQRIHQYSGGVDVTYGGYTLNIDGDYLDGPAAPVAPLPFADGTFIAVGGTGAVYVIAGGAPLPVSTWTAFGTQRPVTASTRRQFGELNPVPSDGTFLVTAAGRIYRLAGGAALPVSSWSLFGGPQKAVTVDPWAIAHAGSAISHLHGTPARGTIVQGLPSGNLWKFVSGGRVAVGGSGGGDSGPGRAGSGPGGAGSGSGGDSSGGVGPGSGSGSSSSKTALSSGLAIAVDDAALTSYPVVKVVPGCTVPQLRDLTLSRATLALTHAHCRLGNVVRPSNAASGHTPVVSRQSPAPGQRHSAGYHVAVTLR